MRSSVSRPLLISGVGKFATLLVLASTTTWAAAPPAPSNSTPTSLAEPGHALSHSSTGSVPSLAQLEKLTPAQREARIEKIRERRVAKARQEAQLTPAEKEIRRAQLQDRLRKRLEALRQKKASGSLTEPEQKQLKRLEEVAKGFKNGPKNPK